jgi:hypothetical protein
MHNQQHQESEVRAHLIHRLFQHCGMPDALRCDLVLLALLVAAQGCVR